MKRVDINDIWTCGQAILGGIAVKKVLYKVIELKRVILISSIKYKIYDKVRNETNKYEISRSNVDRN